MREEEEEEEEEGIIQSTALHPFHSSQISNCRRKGACKIILAQVSDQKMACYFEVQL